MEEELEAEPEHMQAGGWGKPGSMTAHPEGSFSHLGWAMWRQFFPTGEGEGRSQAKECPTV